MRPLFQHESLKRCCTCKNIMPKEDFYKDSGRWDGLDPTCKKCRKELAKSESRKAYLYKYWRSEKGKLVVKRSNAKESTKLRKAAYQKSEKGKATWQRYFRSLKGYHNTIARNKRYAESPEGKDKKKAYSIQYAQSEKGKMVRQIINSRRRDASSRNPLTTEEWANILQRYQHACVYCGNSESLTIDHYIPLSKGGKNSKENIVPACLSCNQKKSCRDPKRLF